MTTDHRAVSGCLRTARILLLLCFLPLFACGDGERLTLGKAREREISGGETHPYRIELADDDYLWVVAEQKGADVLLSLDDPQGDTVLGKIDSPTGERGSEHLYWIAEGGGTYQLTVHTWGARAKAGAYKVRIEALHPAQETDRTRTAAEYKLAEAEDLRGTEHYDQAIQSFETAREHFVALGDEGRVCHIDYRCGEINEDRLHDLDQARDDYERALPHCVAAGDLIRRLNVLTRLGSLLSKHGEKERGRERLLEARRLSLGLADPASLITTLNALGVHHKRNREPDLALRYYSAALDRLRGSEEQALEATTLSNLSNLYVWWGKPEEAIDGLTRALEIHRVGHDREGQAATLTILGHLQTQRGEWEQALATHQQALRLHQEISDRRGEGISLSSIGRVKGELKQHADALALLDKARAIFRQEGDAVEEARTLRMTAAIHLRANQTMRARELYQQARAISDNLRGDIETLAGLAHTARQRGDLSAARRWIKEALDAIETVRTLPSDGDLRTGFFATKQRHYDFYVDLLMEQHDAAPTAGHAADALAGAERARARALLEDLIDSGVDTSQASAKPLTAATIQQQVVDTETLLLEYKLGATRSFLWVVTPTAIATYELPARREIEDAVAEMRRFLAGGRRFARKLQEALHTLSEIILVPACGQLGTKRLLIVPEGTLHHVPFVALPDLCTADSANAPTPLLARHEIVSAPSASTIEVLRRQRAGRRTPEKTLAVLADPVFDPADSRIGSERAAATPHYARLPFSGQEARSITDLLPPTEVLLARGFAANHALATSGALAPYKYLHFATHGEINETQPALSSLVLSLVDEAGQARSGFLYAHEIHNLDLAARLVVLSACETGLGKQVRGEGIIGLTRAFMQAGASSVVVSLWKIEDEVTAELMTRFYRHLLDDAMPPAAALRAAQLSIWQQGRDAADGYQRWQWPYLWAAFTLQGLWE